MRQHGGPRGPRSAWWSIAMVVALGASATWPAPTPVRPAATATPVVVDDGLSGAIDRLYRGFFLREPDIGGFTHWHCLVSKGRIPLVAVADAFATSPEFEQRYGELDDGGFIDLAYRNLFDRSPDAEGRAYWLDLLAAGTTPGHVMAHLTGSAEFRAITADSSPPPIDPNTIEATTCGPVLLTWISRGLPPGFGADVSAIEAVSASTIVHGDLIELVATRDAAGNPIDVPAAGWALPIDGFAIDPPSYAQFQSGTARDILGSLLPGQAVLSESSARVRRMGVGGTLTFRGGHTVTVIGVVDDATAGAAEVIVHRADASAVGIARERFVLLRDRDRAAVEAAIRSKVPAGSYVSIRGSADTPFLRHADRVDPPAHVKLTFGEFAFQDASGREVRIDPAWVAANIVTAEVPLLGRVRCHRAIIPAVRAALAEVADRGHGASVDPSSYAGCHYARRIEPGQGLSRHTWGLALDINIGTDPRGDYATQHPVLVEAMRRQGFRWGGDWEFPDPGHYEASARP